jgi:hypothetical protein
MSLEGVPLWGRLLVGLVVVVVVVLLLRLLQLADAEETTQLPPKGTFVGKPSPWDEEMVYLDKMALAEAYQHHIERLFSVWMSSDEGQPGRAIRGAQQARRAYILVRTAIEEREKKLQEDSGAPRP